MTSLARHDEEKAAEFGEDPLATGEESLAISAVPLLSSFAPVDYVFPLLQPPTHVYVLDNEVPPAFDELCDLRFGPLTFTCCHVAHIAALCGNAAVFDFFRETDKEGIWKQIATPEGLTLHYCAALSGSEFALKLMNELLSTPNLPPPPPLADGYTLAMAAARGGNIDILKLVLLKSDAKTELSAKRIDGWTLTMAAARSGNLEMLKFALSQGGSLDEKRADGGTIAHAAAAGGHLDVLKWLIENKREVFSEVTTDGWTVAHAACTGGRYALHLAEADIPKHIDVLKLIVSANPKAMTAATKDGYTCTMACAASGHVELLDFVLNNGGSLAEKAQGGVGPVVYAAQAGHVDTLTYIAKHDEKVLAEKTEAGVSVALFAAQSGNVEALKVVLAHGGSISMKECDGEKQLTLHPSVKNFIEELDKKKSAA